MTYIATVTSKGQITIPAEIRKYLNLTFSKRVAFIKRKKEVVVKPLTDFYSLKGSVKSTKKYSDKKADQSIGKYIAKQYAKDKKAS